MKKKWFKSIGWTLTVWNASLIMIFAVSFSIYLYKKLESQLNTEVSIFLNNELAEFNQYVSENRENLELVKRQINEESSAMRKYYQMYYALLDSDGQVILQSTDFQPNLSQMRSSHKSALLETEVQDFGLQAGGDAHHIRILTKPLSKKGKTIYYTQVGLNLSRTEKTLVKYRHNILYALPAILALSLAGGYMLARWNLRPISHMAETAGRITVSNLSERLHLRGTGDELDELAGVFNNMVERIDQAYQKLSQFSADAAHELRTPLTSLIGEVEIALSQERTEEEYKNILASNLDELTRLMRLVNNLLLLSQSDKEEKVKTEQIEINSIVRDITEIFDPVAEEKQITLKINMPLDPIYIAGDRWRMEQLISNLLDNAIRYNKCGGAVEVSLSQDDRWARLVVRDTGLGIPPSEQEKIFDRFYRLDSSRSRESGGFGLGLNIVKSIVQAHNGTISLESQEGVGSAFIVQLPTARKSQPSAQMIVL